MTLLPLDQIRIDARSHASALRWIGLLYCKPTKVRLAGESLEPLPRRVAGWRVFVHSFPYAAVAVLLCGLFLSWQLKLEVPPPLTLGNLTLAIGSISFSAMFGFVVGISLSIDHELKRTGITSPLKFDSPSGACIGTLFLWSFLVNVLFRHPSWFIVFGLVGVFAYFRAYYLPFHFLLQVARLRPELYRFHPVAWDDLCLLPFPGLDRLLVRYADYCPEAGEREIERLIHYPAQRTAALRARALLVARRAAAATDLSRLDEILASLSAGEKGFFVDTRDLRRSAHEITVLQARLDTLDRPFLREPFAALLVKEIETFEQQIAGFTPRLSTELRKAAQQWLVIARRQLDGARAAVTREPTYQVFRAGDPVSREREAFVLRGTILGELEQQVMLATGCPGLLVYGRRRMGKSTLLRNLEGLLPPRVFVVNLSMQEARAFTSTPDLVALIADRVVAVVPDRGELPADLKSFERLLDATQRRLDNDDRRLLLAVDEYENLDSKIGEGALSEDLLAVIRESIQTHRRLIWAFAGSHAIDELVHAPWTIRDRLSRPF